MRLETTGYSIEQHPSAKGDRDRRVGRRVSVWSAATNDSPGEPISGRDKPLLGRCRITSLKVGRMEVRSLDGHQVMSFTGREFEALHPVVSLDPDRT